MNSRFTCLKNNAALLGLITLLVVLAVWFIPGNLFPISLSSVVSCGSVAYFIVFEFL